MGSLAAWPGPAQACCCSLTPARGRAGAEEQEARRPCRLQGPETGQDGSPSEGEEDHPGSLRPPLFSVFLFLLPPLLLANCTGTSGGQEETLEGVGWQSYGVGMAVLALDTPSWQLWA